MSAVRIGTPIRGICVWAAAYGRANGRDSIYAVSSGERCLFFVIDSDSGECLHRFEMAEAKHCWGVVATGDAAYAVADGHLYRYRTTPPGNGLEHLGTAIEGEHYSWRLAADDDGAIYGGCYPGGKAFRYDPRTGAFRDYGVIVEGEQYVRCMKAYGGALYMGIGTVAPRLVAMRVDSGERKEIPLPVAAANDSMVYDLDIAWPYLYIRLTPSNTMRVYDLTEEVWIDEIPGAMGLAVSPPDAYGSVYFAKDERLHRYDAATRRSEDVGVPLEGPCVDFGWIAPEGASAATAASRLICIRRDGSYWTYDPTTGRREERDPGLPGGPVTIHSLAPGPDGRIYCGGYFAGGFASFDPATDALSDARAFGQIEGMAAFGDKLYLGVYPKAVLYEYDPERPWVPGVNPTKLASLQDEGQDRPFAFCAAGDALAVGTVPDYGRLGGALALVRPAERRIDRYPGIAGTQSVTSLAYRSGTLYLGGCVWGGLGVKPIDAEALLLAWDPATRRELRRTIPVPGEKAISALAFAPNGRLWGVTAGKLFEFDVDDWRLVRAVEIVPFDWSSRGHFWRGGSLRFEGNVGIVGTSVGTLFHYDPALDRVTAEAKDVWLSTGEREGRTYFSIGTSLYKR
ncbi:WD40 repeat domain-containing protein [Paenibacillus sp.]|uniref:WD40 repeat domain-containing protein n=1 Tax=Paenibacillus sp. TaxID=58172 RepID=UPI002811966C|nr:WD40 repeat domain-containing protein [Paenibacillus sp.]